jgi:outer membrane protein assembly factor BamB
MTSIRPSQLIHRLQKAQAESPLAQHLGRLTDAHRLDLDGLDQQVDRYTALGTSLTPFERRQVRTVRERLQAESLFSGTTSSRHAALSDFATRPEGRIGRMQIEPWSNQFVEQPSERPVLSPDGARLYQLNESGKLQTFSTRTGKLESELELVPYFTRFRRPHLADDGKSMVVTSSSNVWKVDLERQRVVWHQEIRTETVDEPSVLPGGRVLTWVSTPDGRRVIALDGATGQTSWAWRAPSGRVHAPACSDGSQVFLTLEAGGDGGAHRAVDAATGAQVPVRWTGPGLLAPER